MSFRNEPQASGGISCRSSVGALRGEIPLVAGAPGGMTINRCAEGLVRPYEWRLTRCPVAGTRPATTGRSYAPSPAGTRLVSTSSASFGEQYGFSSFGQPSAFSVRYSNQIAPYQMSITGRSL